MLTVKDVLSLPNQLARIEAQLSGKTPAGSATWAGVSLHLSIDGKPVGTGKTNEGGQAIFDYVPKMRGTYAITVQSMARAAGFGGNDPGNSVCVGAPTTNLASRT